MAWAKLFDIKEDLPALNPKQEVNLKTGHFDCGKSLLATSVPTSAPAKLAESINVFNALIHQEVSSAANNEGELKAWIDLQIVVPAKTILNLLRTIQNPHLDPLKRKN